MHKILFFFICALGWEIWFNYGLINGDDVNLRRAEILSSFLPININWLLNSLADSGTICLGGLCLALRLMKNNDTVLKEWNWKFFFNDGNKKGVGSYVNGDGTDLKDTGIPKNLSST